MDVYSSALRPVVAEAVQSLGGFAADPLFAEKFTLAFGTPAPSLAAFRSAIAELPEIKVLPDQVLQGAIGAFSAQTGKLYLSESVVNGDSGRLRVVLLEEIGHYLDSVFNAKDATGDEGAILAALALGNGLSEAELGQLRSKDDLGFIVLDGVEVAIEKATVAEPYLVADINSTSFGSNPSNFINVGGVLYFTANDDVNGTELWRANPATGVVSLLDTYPGSNTSSVSNLTDVNGTLYFTANNGTNGTELYRAHPT